MLTYVCCCYPGLALSSQSNLKLRPEVGVSVSSNSTSQGYSALPSSAEGDVHVETMDFSLLDAKADEAYFARQFYALLVKRWQVCGMSSW